MELLVVITIIAVLAGLIFSGVQSANRTARTMKCLSIIRQWGLAFPLYANDNDGLLPTANTPAYQSGTLNYGIWQNRIGPYLTGVTGTYSFASLRANFHCPGDPVHNWAYATNMYLIVTQPNAIPVKHFADFPHPAVTLLLAEAESAALWNAIPGPDFNSLMQFNHHGNGLANVMYADLHCASLTGTQAAQTSILQFQP